MEVAPTHFLATVHLAYDENSKTWDDRKPHSICDANVDEEFIYKKPNVARQLLSIANNADAHRCYKLAVLSFWKL